MEMTLHMVRNCGYHNRDQILQHVRDQGASPANEQADREASFLLSIGPCRIMLRRVQIFYFFHCIHYAVGKTAE